MMNERYWKIRRLLPFEFTQYSHEQLTDMILNHPQDIIKRLEAIQGKCAEAIKELTIVE